MDTTPLDIIYFLKNTPYNEEFRHSLRSVCQNMPFNRVWVFGGCPQNIVPDVRVRVVQKGKTKWDRVRNMYKMVCENKEITDDFIMFHDDFFVMKPTDHLDLLHRCSLTEHIEILERGRRSPSEYSKLLRKASTVLGPEALSFELHTPFIFNKRELSRLLDEYPQMHCMRTIYGNLVGSESRRSNDVKIFNIHPDFNYQDSRLLSTDDSIVNINNDIWRWLRKTLDKKCKYEL